MAMTFPSNPTTGQQYSVSGGPTYTWDGTVWKILTPGSQFSEQQFTATAGQTSFTVSGGYVIGAVDVYRNGVKLIVGVDFLATDLSTVTLVNAANAGDTIEVVKAAQILYADTLRATNNLSDIPNAATALSNLGGLPKAGGTMTGPLTLGGLLDTGATGQIKFPAAQNASSDVNTLDDYEEGTWTPSYSGGTFTYSTQNGQYTKVGNLVTVQCYINTNSASGSGQVNLTGLPFPVVSNTRVAVPIQSASWVNAPFWATVDGSSATTTVLLAKSKATNGNFTYIQVSDFQNSSGGYNETQITCTYRTN
jgi:hypothetical protein